MSDKKPNAAEWANAVLRQVELVYRRGAFYAWTGCHYRRVEDQLVRRTISDFISAVMPGAATARLVNDVVETISQMAAIADEPPEPLRLDGLPAENALAFQNGVFLVDQYIAEQLREPKLLPPPQS